MRTWCTSTVATLLIVGQLVGPSAGRCWFMDGVDLKLPLPGPGPYWLNRDATLNGWLMFAPVLNGDRDAAARAMGFSGAKDCK